MTKPENNDGNSAVQLTHVTRTYKRDEFAVRALDNVTLSLMKPTACLINTSRGPIVTESDLVEALHARTIAGAAIDVFDQEPLPPNHPFRTMTNVLATPHIGYGSRGLYETFYRDTVANIRRWLEESSTGMNASTVS